jgi:hypothetical protein
MIGFAFRDLGLLPTQWKAVARRAKQAGKTTPEYLRLLIEEDLLAGKSFDDLLRPIRRDFKKSGVTEAALDQIISRGRRGGTSKRQRAEGTGLEPRARR